MFEEAFRVITNNATPEFNLLSSLASIVTIAGFVSLFAYMYKIRVSKKCQRKIIIDLARHFFVNAAIVEVIRIRIRKEDFAARPIDGVFSRFATLDKDMDLSRFSVTSRNFNNIHQISLYIRNYNIVAEVAERHFADPDMADLWEYDLNEIFQRGVDVSKKLIELSRKLGLGLSKKSLAYELRRHPELNRSGLLSCSIAEADIPARSDFEGYSYYDEIGLKDLLDKCIKQFSTSIRFIPIAGRKTAVDDKLEIRRENFGIGVRET